MSIWRRPNRQLARDLETPRLKLLSLGRLRAFFLTIGWRHDPELMLGLTLTQGQVSLWRWLRRRPRPNQVTRFVYAIVPKEVGRPVGMIAVKLSKHRTASSHIALHDRAWWGTQVTIEARQTIISHFFEHADIDRFVSSINSRNSASVFIYRKLGFTVAGTHGDEKQSQLLGRTIERIDFEFTREAWESRRVSWTAPAAIEPQRQA